MIGQRDERDRCAESSGGCSVAGHRPFQDIRYEFFASVFAEFVVVAVGTPIALVARRGAIARPYWFASLVACDRLR